MHKFRSAARHSAWKKDNNNWNPFSRVPSRQPRQQDDVEQGGVLNGSRAPSTHSENCAQDIENGNADGPSDPKTKRSATVPSSPEPDSATSQHPPVGGFDESHKIGGANGEPTGANLSTQGTRQRKRPGLREVVSFKAFGKRSKGEKDLEKTDSEDESKSKLRKTIPLNTQLRAVLFPQWLTINWLLLLVPVGIAAAQVDSIPAIAVFVINFLAIVPLAGILSYATEEIALRVGETLGGLLNASFGNAVELIVGIIALVKGEVIIVQTSLIGSMLSNLLLVMGMCFFFGGLNRLEQNFNVTVAQTAASLLALAFGCLIIPTAFTWGIGGASKTNSDEKITRGTAIIMLIVYGSYLIFQLKSHKELYNQPSQKAEKRKGAQKQDGESMAALVRAGAGQAAHVGGQINNRDEIVHAKEDEEEEPQLSLIGAIVALAGSTALVGVCAEFLVDSINEVTCQYHISQYFVGLILLPIVGNAAEHATAVTVAIKDKMDLAIGVAVGSSMQIALLVLPLMAILGWAMDKDLTFVFDDFQIAVLFVAVLLVNYLIGDGKSHWMEGVLLMSLYIIIATTSWFYPTPADQNQC